MDNPEFLLGTIIDGRYRLREFIGNGSYGSVFAAEELTLGRVISQVAVKLISPENDTQRQKVLQEILGLARLNHDYIISYRSSGEVREGDLAGTIFLATELGDTTLARLLKASRRLSTSELRDLIRGVALALAHIHAEGAIHGDVKPANIIRVRGRWKLGDLGLVRSSHQKQVGPAHGSLTYMAPEMLRHEFSAANDIYALGITLLHYFTGKFAHEGGSREVFVENLKSQAPTVPESVREPWRTLILECVQRTASARWTAAKIENFVAPSSTHFNAAADAKPIIVAAQGYADYATIKEAIDSALPGSQIVVHPGKYRDSLRIDKPLEIIGEGAPGEIVISTRDNHCIEFVTKEPVVVRGLTMRVKPGPRDVECYAVDIGMGNPLLEDCYIRSLTLACVAVHDSADPTLRRCTISGSRDVGVFVYDDGRSTYEDCEITGHGGTGISISDGGQAKFQRCFIHKNRSGGVAIFPGGRASFDGCRIVDNGKSGATVGSKGQADFHGCLIVDNKTFGLILKDAAAASLVDCDLRDNHDGPWRAAANSDLEHRDNLT
jgi:parallel beta-helix repeat protein